MPRSGESKKNGARESRRDPQNIQASLFHLIQADHDAIETLLAELQLADSTNIDGTLSKLSRLEDELLVHLEGEERFLYTALEQHEETTRKVLESYEEHLLAKTIITSFNSIALDDKRWFAKLAVLKKLFAVHLEEEKDLIRSAKRLLTEKQLEGITQQFLELKRRGKGAEVPIR